MPTRIGRYARGRYVINLTPLVFIALCAVIGALLGSVLIGLAVGLGIVFVASVVD